MMEATLLLDCGKVRGAVSSDGLRCRVSNLQAEVPASYDTEKGAVYCKVPATAAGGVCTLVDAEGRLLCAGSKPAPSSSVLLHEASLQSINEDPHESSTASTAGLLAGLSLVDRLLPVLILLAMVLGVLLGYFVPSAKRAFESVTVDSVSLPVAIGLWGMMWPVLAKVKYEVLGDAYRHRKGWVQLGLSVFINWVVGPLVMLALAWATLPDVAGFRNGIIIVGLARCIAMVLIWNQMAGGDPEFCATLVAINSILQMVLFAPYSLLLLQVVSRQYLDGSGLQLDFWTVCRSVLIYLGAPLAAALITRYPLIWTMGREWYDNKFMRWFGPVALLSLLYTVVVLFTLQGHEVISQIGDVCRIAVPLTLYFAIMWFFTFFWFRSMGYPYTVTVTQAFTGSSNNFELAIAISAGVFGSTSPEALAATIGPLIEVPALLALVYVGRWLQGKLDWKAAPPAPPTAMAPARRRGSGIVMCNQTCDTSCS